VKPLLPRRSGEPGRAGAPPSAGFGRPGVEAEPTPERQRVHAGPLDGLRVHLASLVLGAGHEGPTRPVWPAASAAWTNSRTRRVVLVLNHIGPQRIGGASVKGR